MDVLLKTFLLFSALTLVACGKKDDGGDPILKSNAGSCQTQEIAGQYIAKWKDGRLSRVRASSENALIEKFIEPNRDKLDFVEPDTVITLPDPVVERGINIQAVEANWQHVSMQTAYAWDKGLIGANVIVAVVDSGADITHPQLADQLSINAGEVPGNGIDDDNNGLVDDYNGYDFFRNSGAIKDVNGHGTHVSGIIAAKHTADINLPKGVAPGVKLLPLNFMKDTGEGDTSNAILALKYARSRGAKIINASWGSGKCSLALKDTILELKDAGILFVAAAGNNGLNIDLYPNFPASFNLENMLVVAASTSRGLMADFSNFSVNQVHVAAPGRDIYSSVPANSYSFYSGTSMAAPQVSGLAALLWSARPDLSMARIKEAIMNGVHGQAYAVVTRGEVDAKLSMQDIGQ